jgi:hypothetical protein
LLLNTCAFSSSRSASSDTSRSSPSGSPHSSSFRFHYHHSPPLQPRKHLHLSAVWFLKNALQCSEEVRIIWRKFASSTFFAK